MSIGFIGLGNLGAAIATRLIQMDEDVITYNRTKEKAIEKGFTVVNSPKDLLKNCDVIFLCLFDSPAVDNVFNMQDGLLCDQLKGKTIIDLSTHHYNDVLNPCISFLLNLLQTGAGYQL